MKFREIVKWYSSMYRSIYGLTFQPKSFWNYKRNTEFDKKIQDVGYDLSMQRELDAKEGDFLKGSRQTLSKFNSEYAKNTINFYTTEGSHILDPFGGRSRKTICNELGRKYTGFEINENYALPEVIVDDCFNIDKHIEKDKKFDFLYTCPPYWNMEIYSKDLDGDLSIAKTYEEFFDGYEKRMLKCAEYVDEKGLIIVTLCDFRYEGKFYSFHNDTINMFKKGGWNLYDLIILEMNPAKRHVYYPLALAKRRMFTTHEYTLIFSKNTDIEERKFKEEFNKYKDNSYF